jgi:hypothetical protein
MYTMGGATTLVPSKGIRPVVLSVAVLLLKEEHRIQPYDGDDVVDKVHRFHDTARRDDDDDDEINRRIVLIMSE